MTDMVFIVGPTASGKTEAALRLAESVGGEIVCADSMQVYRRMDIGTAKATPSERARVPHHLIDIREPWQSYSVAEYQRDAQKAIEEIRARGRLPVVVGGTGLYIWSLLHPWRFSDSPQDPQARGKWEAFAWEMGKEALHRELRLRDPASAERLHPNDVRRVVRALEIFESTGEPMRTEETGSPAEGRLLLGLCPPRDELYRRIDRRVDAMLEAGLVDEVRLLAGEGACPAWQSMQGLGYRQMLPHLAGECTLEQVRVQIARQTRQYAKRQLTWFRREASIRWLDPLGPGNLLQKLREAL